jgi:hypothetical protein
MKLTGGFTHTGFLLYPFKTRVKGCASGDSGAMRVFYLGTPQTPIATLDTGLIEENKDKRKG